MSNYGKASAPEVIYSSIFQDLITLSKRSPPPLNSIQLSSKTRPMLLFRNAFYHYFQALVMQRRIRYKNSAQMDKILRRRLTWVRYFNESTNMGDSLLYEIILPKITGIVSTGHLEKVMARLSCMLLLEGNWCSYLNQGTLLTHTVQSDWNRRDCHSTSRCSKN